MSIGWEDFLRNFRAGFRFLYSSLVEALDFPGSVLVVLAPDSKGHVFIWTPV